MVNHEIQVEIHIVFTSTVDATIIVFTKNLPFIK